MQRCVEVRRAKDVSARTCSAYAGDKVLPVLQNEGKHCSEAAHHQMMLRRSDLFRSAVRIEYDAPIILPRACHAECALRPFLAPWDCEGQNPVLVRQESSINQYQTRNIALATALNLIPYAFHPFWEHGPAPARISSARRRSDGLQCRERDGPTAPK